MKMILQSHPQYLKALGETHNDHFVRQCSYVFTHVCVEVMYPGPVYEVLECASHFSLSISVFITVTCTIERHQVSTAAAIY